MSEGQRRCADARICHICVVGRPQRSAHVSHRRGLVVQVSPQLGAQLELAQRNYMDEESLDYLPERAERLSDTIGKMLTSFTKSAESQAPC